MFYATLPTIRSDVAALISGGSAQPDFALSASPTTRTVVRGSTAAYSVAVTSTNGFSSAVSLIGTVYLGLAVNWLTAALGAFTLTSYIFVYTPLKRVSTICTLVGAIPGAVPPLMGWTAATGHLGIPGWIAFAVVFLWQLPHFMAISWIYREDYGRAGFAMLAVRDADGRATARQAILYSVLLIGVSALIGIWAVVASAALLAMSVIFARTRTTRNARRLFMTSNLYLIAAMILLVLG